MLPLSCPSVVGRAVETAALATPEAKVTEEHDGVHVDTITLFLDA